MVYNQEESSEKLIDLYREYEKQVIYKNKERPICDADFCEFKIELLCQNGKCRLENDGFMGSCINCK